MRWDESAIARHNDGVARLWRDFEAGTPARVPVVFNFSRRFYLLTPWLNERGWSFQQYFEWPEVQWDLRGQQHRAGHAAGALRRRLHRGAAVRGALSAMLSS